MPGVGRVLELAAGPADPNVPDSLLSKPPMFDQTARQLQAIATHQRVLASAALALLLVAGLFLASGLLSTAGPQASSASEDLCAPEGPYRIATHFRALNEAVAAAGVQVGNATECEHLINPGGDSVQKTEYGFGFYRRATGVAMFSNGMVHFALTQAGLIAWGGSSLDPTDRAALVQNGPPGMPLPTEGEVRAQVPSFRTADQCQRLEEAGPVSGMFNGDGRYHLRLALLCNELSEIEAATLQG